MKITRADYYSFSLVLLFSWGTFLPAAYGEGTPQDYKEALKWYVKAAEQGDAESQVNLGVMYGLGQGTLQDYVRAHMWFNLAAASGITKAVQQRDRTAKLMTPQQISEAERMAREWKKK